MRRILAIGAAPLVLLGACASPARYEAPAQGVGFGDYDTYMAAQGVAPAAGFAAPVPGAPVGGAAPAPGVIGAGELAAAGIGAPPVATATFGAAPLPGVANTDGTVTVASSGVAGDVATLRATGLEASPSNAAPTLVGVPSAPATTGGISDEQDFSAVASRETIESDAARRAAQAAQYQVVAPTALPPAPADTGPNIVEYALSAPNAKGQEWYSRFAFSGEGRMLRNCNAYSTPDEAQRDFLARGGPERDPRGLDPDGDGFACAWDPAPFRAAVAAN